MADDWRVKYKKVGEVPGDGGNDWRTKYKRVSGMAVPAGDLDDPDRMGSLEAIALKGSNALLLNEMPRVFAGVNSLRDVTLGDSKLNEFGDRFTHNRKYAESLLDKAQKDRPTESTIAEIGGGLASGLVAPALGAGLKGALLTGAIAGHGATRSDDTSDQLQGAFGGAVTGGALHGALGLAGKLVPKTALKKGASWILGVPEELTETYLQNPEAVKNAPTRFELAKKYQQSLDDLGKEVVYGSKASRDVLDTEGARVAGSEVAGQLDPIIKNLELRREGMKFDDPAKEAAYQHLLELKQNYLTPRPGVEAGDFSTNKMKDLVQAFDSEINYAKGKTPGNIIPKDEVAIREARGAIDAMLKRKSPEYEKVMKGVASDAELLTNAKDIGQSPERLANVFRRYTTDQYGGGQAPKATLEALDRRLGTNYAQEAKYATTKELFDKSQTQGSRNVQLGGAIGKFVGQEDLGKILGAGVDRYGRQVATKAIDYGVMLNKMYKNAPNREAFERIASPIFEAAKSGNKEAALAVSLFLKNEQD